MPEPRDDAIRQIHAALRAAQRGRRALAGQPDANLTALAILDAVVELLPIALRALSR